MSFIPNNQTRLDGEVAHQREQELRESAERYAATHPDGAEESHRPGGWLKRLRAFLGRSSNT